MASDLPRKTVKPIFRLPSAAAKASVAAKVETAHPRGGSDASRPLTKQRREGGGPVLSDNVKTEPTAGHASHARPVLRFVRNLFMSQVKLEHRGGEVRLVLQEPSTTLSGFATSHLIQPAQGDEHATHAARIGISDNMLKRMKYQLEVLLDLHPGTRSVFLHLNYLDKALGHHGADCFRDLPVELLHKALKQLDSLVQSASPGPVGLANLRDCLVLEISERGSHKTDADEGSKGASDFSGQLSDFNVSNKLSVSEASHSDFMKATQQLEAVIKANETKP